MPSRIVLLLSVLTLAPAVAAQAPLHSGSGTGVAASFGYSRSVGGSDINTFAAALTATVSPRVDLSASYAHARTYRHLGSAAAASATVYPLATDRLHVGVLAGLVVPDLDHLEFAGVGGATLAVGLVDGPVRVVPSGSVTVGSAFDGRDDPTWTLGGSVALILPVRTSQLAIEPYITTAYDLDVSNSSFQTVGLSLRPIWSRGD